MAEYINREKLKTDFYDKAYYISHGQNNVERGMTLYGINQMIDEQQPANVVEREKIDKAIKEMEIHIKCNTDQKTGHVNILGQGQIMMLDILKNNIGDRL